MGTESWKHSAVELDHCDISFQLAGTSFLIDWRALRAGQNLALLVFAHRLTEGASGRAHFSSGSGTPTKMFSVPLPGPRASR
jgi:hypothetical protein